MKNFTALADTNKKFYTRFYCPLKIQIFDFLTVFLNVLNILENYAAIPEILGSILRTGFEKLICLCEYSKMFLIPSILALGKVKILFL